jgi:hypothetical protein
VYSTVTVAPVTEKVTEKFKFCEFVVTVPVVSTVTAAVEPKTIVHPPPAVARVPCEQKVPVSHAVEEEAVAEIERNTNDPSSLHGALERLAVTVCAALAPMLVPNVVVAVFDP